MTRWGLVFVAAAIACASTDTPGVDAGADAASGAEVDPIAPAPDAQPAPPADALDPPDAAEPAQPSSIDAEDAAPAADAGPAEMPPPPPAFFSEELVHRVEITIDPATWQRYLEDHRFFGLRHGPTWFRAEFRIDGTPLHDVAFHTFGWGSRSANKEKPNLSLDINRNVPGQSLAGINRMRLKNNGQDVTGLRQTLIYRAMRGAGLLAPRSSFAELFVNGQPYGFYLVEEAFTKRFVRERTGNDDGPAYEAQDCEGFVVPPEGGCERIVAHYNRDFNDMVGMGEDLIALCHAMNGPPDTFPAAIKPLIAFDDWIVHIAIDTALAGNRDGYSVTGGNFRLYHDTAMNKLRLIMLGSDDTFGLDGQPPPDFLAPKPDPGCVSYNPVFRDVFLERLVATPEGRALYQETVRKLRTGIMARELLHQRIDGLWTLLGARIVADPLRNPGVDPAASRDEIKRYIDERWMQLAAAGF